MGFGLPPTWSWTFPATAVAPPGWSEMAASMFSLSWGAFSGGLFFGGEKPSTFPNPTRQMSDPRLGRGGIWGRYLLGKHDVASTPTNPVCMHKRSGSRTLRAAPFPNAGEGSWGSELPTSWRFRFLSLSMISFMSSDSLVRQIWPSQENLSARLAIAVNAAVGVHCGGTQSSPVWSAVPSSRSRVRPKEWHLKIS